MKEETKVNKDFEYAKTLGKIVKIILSNNWKFSGKVLDVTEHTLIILDKFGQRTTLSKSDIILCTEINSNG